MVHTNKKRLLYFSLLILLFVSCHKDPLQATDQPTASDLFTIFWNKMSNHYVFWDIDKTDWSYIYTTYKPLFDQLDYNIESDIKKSVSYYKSICNQLIDAHFQINFQYKSIKDSIISPTAALKKKQPGFHFPYNYMNITTAYLDSGYLFTNQSGNDLRIVTGTIKHRILYFTCNHFTLATSFYSPVDVDTKKCMNYFFYQIAHATDNKIKALVIDVRGNTGGNMEDANFLLGRMIKEPLHFGFSKYKNGPDKDNFTPLMKSYINPYGNAQNLNLPIMVLADSYSASLSELIIQAVRALPNSRIIGERTFGATGIVAPGELYNAGSFEIPGFLKVQASSCQFFDRQKISHEQLGIPPDIEIPFDAASLNNGRDLPLEKAIELTPD
jgi:hypothetical protein